MKRKQFDRNDSPIPIIVLNIGESFYSLFNHITPLGKETLSILFVSFTLLYLTLLVMKCLSAVAGDRVATCNCICRKLRLEIDCESRFTFYYDAFGIILTLVNKKLCCDRVPMRCWIDIVNLHSNGQLSDMWRRGNCYLIRKWLMI